MPDSLNNKKVKWYKRIGDKLYNKYFGFEQGIDITDDVAVLHRRNIVIKNIIFISNLFYTILLLILSISTNNPADWVITVISFPITFLINNLLKTLIQLDNKDKTKQMIAMYVASLYIFLSSILVYIKLYNVGSSETVYFETASYVLVYYSLVVISLYQYKALLHRMFLSLFVSLTSVHFIFTYHFLNNAQDKSMSEYFSWFIRSDYAGDFILRTLIFLLFYLILNVIVSISQYMQDERKKELIKRRQVQNDFATIVGKLFNAVFINAHISVNKELSYNISELSLKLASYMGYDQDKMNRLSNFSLIHLKYNEIKDFNIENTFDENIYEELKIKTTLGADIVNRMELTQNVDMMSRAHQDSNLNEENIKSIMRAHHDLDSQIIMLADIYITLRQLRSYKRPYNHKITISAIKEEYSSYFDQELMNRFFMFESEINEIFDKLSKLDLVKGI